MLSMRGLVTGLSPITLLLAGTLTATAGNAWNTQNFDLSSIEYRQTAKQQKAPWHVATWQDNRTLFNLRLLGYTKIKMINGPRWRKTVFACLNNDRVHLEVSGAGRIGKLTFIGRCRSKRSDELFTASIKKKSNSNSASNIRTMLAMSGYKQIELRAQGKSINTARACRSDKLMRLDMNKSGKVERVSRIGTCSNERIDNIVTAAIPGIAVMRPTPLKALKPLRAYLRTKGFNRMVFTDRTAPHYKVEACQGEKKMRIDMRDSGFITKISRTGTCSNFAPQQQKADMLATAALQARPSATANSKMTAIRGNLMLSGYKRINVKKIQNDSAIATACLSEKRMRLDMDIKGKVVRKSRIGTCKSRSFMRFAKATKKSRTSNILNMLALSGYKQIKVTTNKPMLKTALACRGEKLMRLNLDTAGTVIRKSRVGTCGANQYDDIVTAAIPGKTFERPTPFRALKPIRAFLRTKGFNRMVFTDRTAPFYTVTACQNEKQMRIDMRDSGSITKISRIGTCSNFAPLKDADTKAITMVSAERRNQKAKAIKVRNMLALSGYKQINIAANQAMLQMAKACHGEKLMRLDLDATGTVIRKSRVGSCGSNRYDDIVTAAIPGKTYVRPTPMRALKPIRAFLRTKGFNRMVFTDRTAPFYTVAACQNEKQMRIDMRDSGSITKISRIGTCSNFAPLKDADTKAITMVSATSRNQNAEAIKVRNMLALSGYKQINVATNKPVLNTAMACRGEKLMRLNLDTAGTVIRKSRVGTCGSNRYDDIVTAAIPGKTYVRPTPIRALKPIRAFLRTKGFNRMVFTDRTAPFYKVTACQNEKQMRIDMRDSGSILKVSRIGTCSYSTPNTTQNNYVEHLSF